MSTSLPLPPSGRDFLAYNRVVVDAASTRTVAEELKISQTRVRQVVKRVLDWMHQNLPAHSETDDVARVNLAQHIAADRLQNFYGLASRSWQQTGETKYANLAIKVLLAQTKLPALPGTLEALAADAILGPLNDAPACDEHEVSNPDLPSPAPQNTAAVQSPAPSTPSSFSIPPSAFSSPPPPRDCSPAPQTATPIANAFEPAPTPTPDQQTLSTAPPKFQSAVRRAFLHSAHHLLDISDSPAVTELRITPQSPGLSINKPLNRSERRRLRRLATRS